MPTTYERATPCLSCATRKPMTVRTRPAIPAPRKRVASVAVGKGVAEEALMLLQASALFERDIVNRGVVGALKRAHISDHRPAIFGAKLVSIREHRVLAVGDRVKDLALGHAAHAVIMVGRGCDHPVGLCNAVTVTQRTVARSAVDLVAVLAALHEGFIHDD